MRVFFSLGDTVDELVLVVHDKRGDLQQGLGHSGTEQKVLPCALSGEERDDTFDIRLETHLYIGTYRQRYMSLDNVYPMVTQ